ncbi:unnamed protein product [Parascedosporium putredinis]|uniref:C3H1-type domain-containing protein n=1 Tax=Parascedosporium putredinis TaxID=1442378 RepID=A0A9P1M6R3_9PEZI|nr:unnamed protein product [Parascedosporium putredinis]CAI7988930.1 unnamed protein product [Parascedosporium putredinis]
MDTQTFHTYMSKMQAYRQADAEREALLVDIIEKYEGLLREYNQKCDDYRNEAQESNPFIFVAIDGDGAIFDDKYLSAGPEGGARAAQHLYEALQEHVSELYPEVNTQEWSIVVHIALNVEGLAKRLVAGGIIASVPDLYAFGRAFTRTQPLFTLVDIGFGKEQADHKIRENLRFMTRVSQCKHIVFGPCHDNGYLPVLEEYKRNANVASRFSLLSSTAPEAGYLKLGFPIKSFDGVFRKTPLPSVIAKPASPPSPVRVAPAAAAPAPAPGSSPTSAAANFSYASVGSNRTPHPVRKLGYNYCNRHHLMGTCPNGNMCSYEHGEPLPASELLVLRFKSRSIKCPYTTYCEDVDCPFSHHCRMGKDKCTNDVCRYADTHHMELRPAARILADGKRVALVR